MITILLNSIALDPNRWTSEKIPYFRLLDLIEPIGEAGFRYVEVWQQHILPEDAETVMGIRDVGNALGVAFPIVGAYPKLHLDSRDQEQELEQFRQIVERAQILGSKVIKIFVGTKGSEDLDEVEYEQSVAFLDQLVTLAGEHDLRITGEMHGKTLFDGVSSTLQVVETIGSDNFSVCYQPYNFKSTNEAIEDFISVVENSIHVHYQGKKNGRLDYLEHSDIDYAHLTRELIRQQFDGYLCIEFVKDCVVENPSDFSLGAVLANAQRDRKYIVNILDEHDTEYSG
jgi:sugar phosphate isomerase/epimerase